SGQLVLAPVADWLRTPRLRSAARGLDPVWRREVDRLAPDIASPVATGQAVAPGAHDGPGRVGGDRARVDAWQRLRFLQGLAQPFLAVRGPLLLVLDNLQWCDRETLSWLSALLGLATDRPLLVVTTLRSEVRGRPSPTSGWIAGLRATGVASASVDLEPLDRAEVATLSASITGRELSPQQARLLHETTGGFPLYVIEAARAAGVDRVTVAADDRLGSVLRLRIEQTSAEAQETAGLAAALGRDVTLDLLTEASDLDHRAVARAVDELWRCRILHELGTGYDFGHDLLRDAAYDLVSPPRRWLLHRRLAQALELSSAGREEEVAVLLAEQYDRAGRPDKALAHYRTAAEVAAGRYAAGEAVRLHRRALDIVVAQPPGRLRDERELDCLLAVAAPLNASEGYGSPELRTLLERAVELADHLGTRRRLLSALLGLWTSRFVRGDVPDSLQVASRALSMAEDDESMLGEAHFAYAGSAMSLGRPAEAVVHFDLAHDRCRGAESLVVGSMPEVHALAWSAHAHWLLGEHDLAGRRAEEAVDRARGYAHPYSLAVALAYAAITGQLQGDREGMAAAVAELNLLSEEYSFAYYGEWGLVLDGWLRGGEEGIVRVRRGIANLKEQQCLARMPYWLSLLADLQARIGRPRDAMATLDAAHTAASVNGDLWWQPEILRMRAGHAGGSRRLGLAHAGVELARSQGSVALLQRGLAGLAAAGAPAFGSSSWPNAEGTPAS
ncbi:MAG: hypothetical protein WB441_08640, partial [Nocardioidaceae bacterium]